MNKDTSGSEPVEYSFLERPTPRHVTQIIDLYRMADWWTDGVDTPDQIGKLISGSHCFCVASMGGDMVGIGRAISDGVSDAYIQDITVDEAFRRRGIASQIVNALVRRLQEDGLGWIGLIAERGTQDFYVNLGFETMDNSTPMLKSTP